MPRILSSTQHRQTESAVKSSTPLRAQQRQWLCHDQKIPVENGEQQ